jgi:hypothetical protein
MNAASRRALMVAMATIVLAGPAWAETWLRRDKIAVEDDWLRRMGPAHFSHINFCGTMRFGVDKFAAALIQRAPGQAARLAS